MKRVIISIIFVSLNLLAAESDAKNQKKCVLNVYAIARTNMSELQFNAIEVKDNVKEQYELGADYIVKILDKNGNVKEKRGLNFITKTYNEGADFKKTLKSFFVLFKCSPDNSKAQLYHRDELLAESEIKRLSQRYETQK